MLSLRVTAWNMALIDLIVYFGLFFKKTGKIMCRFPAFDNPRKITVVKSLEILNIHECIQDTFLTFSRLQFEECYKI